MNSIIQVRNLLSSLPRKTLIRWSCWFFGFNVLLYWILGFFYLQSVFPIPAYPLTLINKIAIFTFIGFSYIGHLALLAYLPCIVLVIPAILIFPQRHFIFIGALIVATAAATLFMIDVFVYTHYRYHLNGFITTLLFSGEVKQVFGLSWLEWLRAGIYFVCLFIFELTAALITWKLLFFSNSHPLIKRTTISLITGTLFLSYNFLAFAAAQNFHPLTQQSFIFPLYNNVLLTIFPVKQGIEQLEGLGRGHYAQPSAPNKPLCYPIHPLVFHPTAKTYNIVIIAIDTWRFDMVNSQVMPHVNNFAQDGCQFTNHYSGGNCTQPGIFSLFYGLPGNYWAAVTAQKQQPLLIETLIKRGYTLGVFASAALTAPAFGKNVFLNVKNLQLTTPGETPYLRDGEITHRFQQFLAHNQPQKKPFFAFLFYDAAHSYCEDGNPINCFQPAVAVCYRPLNKTTDPTPYLNRYKNALHFVDAQVGQDLAMLKQANLLSNTIVILTGDHGNEFNDTKLGYWEHSTNYTHYQVQTPLILHWPQKKPAIYTWQTSHYDLAPTLLSFLGCQNPPLDYSIGQSLFNPTTRSYLLASSYIDFGIIEPNQITEVLPTGDYTIYDKTWHPLSGAKPHKEIILQAFSDMQKFYSIAPRHSSTSSG